MSRERTDDFLKWRGLLDQPDAGLDQVLDDREATWQKLADRLGERRRNHRSGYRVAAACLLFALLVPAFRLFQDRHGAAGVHQSGHPVDLLPSDQRRSTNAGGRSTPATAVRQQRGGDRLHSAASDESRSSRQASAAASGMDQLRAAKAPARKMGSTPLAALADIGSSPASIIAAPPDPASESRLPTSSPAKPLKVVHQNEIRGGNTPSPAVTVTSYGRLIDLFRPSPLQPSSASPPAEDPALLKIKLSPSN